MSRAAIAAVEAIRTHARQLKMGLARAFEELARQAREERWSYEDYLAEALSVEVASRVESAVRHRLRAAAFPEMKTLDEFDFHAAEGITAQQIAELARARPSRRARDCHDDQGQELPNAQTRFVRPQQD
jgi:DNA replication protein DnaC